MYQKFNTIKMDEKTKRSLPLLNTHETWLKIYGELDDENIVNKLKELESLIEGQEEARKNFHDLSVKKKESMSEIIRLSDRINNEKSFGHLDMLDREKERLEYINFDLDNVRFEAEEYPKKIRKANYELLELTVQYSYDELIRREEENTAINAEMVEIRDRLRDLFAKRTENENWNNETYVFLHSALGARLIERIDVEIEDE